MLFFKGSSEAKVDGKNRFVLPQAMRYGLVEGGSPEFAMALGMGGCLTIYKKSTVEKIVRRFRSKQHDAKYRKFFTLFFSTLHHLSCDKLGRVVIPPVLKRAVKIGSDIVIAGVLNKIEIWPKEKYLFDLETFLEGGEGLSDMMEEAFSLLEGEESGREMTSDPEEAEREYEALV